MTPHARTYHLINYSRKDTIQEAKSIWKDFPDEVKRRVRIYNIDAEDIDKNIPLQSIRYMRAAGMFYDNPGNQAKNRNMLHAIRRVVSPDGLVIVRFSAASRFDSDDRRSSHQQFIKELTSTAKLLSDAGFHIVFRNSQSASSSSIVSSVSSQTTGGIDFDPANLNLNTKGNVFFDLPLETIRQFQTSTGMTFQILKIEKGVNLQGLLGQEQELSLAP